MVRTIQLPRDWSPRWYQRRLFGALDGGKKRAAAVWHRRAGKDVAMVNYGAIQTQRRVASYWHVLPMQKQARKVIWQGITSSGQRIIDQAFPIELRKRTREDEMLIEMRNGSIWQLVGGDNYDALVGSNVAGVTWSEFALTDPRSWDYVRPILLESGGWSAFISTPRGRNHWYDMVEMAKRDPEWFVDVLTAADTGVFTPEQLESERRSMPAETFLQEYFCSFDVQNFGDIYADTMSLLAQEGRIGSVPYDPRYPVDTVWDVGWRDATAIWFVQQVGRDLHFIDFVGDRNKKLTHYFGELRKKPYVYGRHIGPHDMERGSVTETMLSVAAAHGFHFAIAPRLPLPDGIEAVRNMLPRCRFDAEKCAYGIRALKSYHYKYDEAKRVLSREPVHDWSSDPADSIRYYAVTPAHYGVVPQWAKQIMDRYQGSTAGIGHNGGPALTETYGGGGDFDPLAQFRELNKR